MITVTGQATEITISGSVPLAGATVGAYRNGADSTAIATATTDASGNYTITITTNGQALDGYLKASKTDYTDTYLYPPFALAENFDGASLKMVKKTTFPALYSLCGVTPDDTKGLVAAIVASAPNTSAAPVEGATVSSTPAASKYCYNMGALPNKDATVTAADGIGYMFNVTGETTVSAMKTGSTFASHKVNARAGALTTTLIVPSN